MTKQITAEDEITMIYAKALQEEIDREIVETIHLTHLVKEGWILPACNYQKHNSEIGAWVHSTAKGEYGNLNGKWVFKDPADATLFTLKWS